MLKLLAMDKIKPPKTAVELQKYEPTAMYACSAIKDSSIVYLYGNGIVEGGTAVIAYDAKALTDGGPVLLQNGEVKTMTAAEFAAAPKADKK